MNLSTNKDSQLTLFFILFLLYLLYLFVNQLTSGYAKESWQITEWLINYQGGFVRRGLKGEVILRLCNYFNLNPYYTILLLCSIAYLMLLLYFVRAFIKNGYTLYILPFVFFLGAPIINNFWVRTDILIILIFIITIRSALIKSNIYLILTNILFIIGLLIHESIGFFGFPILLLIFINKYTNYSEVSQPSIKSIILSLLKLGPSIITFLLCLYYKGSFTISRMIWNSWTSFVFPIQTNDNDQIPAAIGGLSRSLGDQLSGMLASFRNSNEGFSIPIVWFIILVLIYYLLTNTDKLNGRIINYNVTSMINKINISNILIVQFLCISPLFILGSDYGRWVFLWVISSFSIIILIPGEILSTLFPTFITNFGCKINSILDHYFSKSQYFVYIIVLFIAVPFSNNGMENFYSQSPIVSVLNFIMKLIYSTLINIKELVF